MISLCAMQQEKKLDHEVYRDLIPVTPENLEEMITKIIFYETEKVAIVGAARCVDK